MISAFRPVAAVVRPWLRAVMACVAVAAFARMTPARAAAGARPPNVVVLLSDDQGWGDLGITGNTNLATPNIDALGRGGALFERFYVCAVCAPTRAEFLTGRYHPRGGVRGVSTGEERLNPDEFTIARAFKDAGYATGAFGKWHNGSQWPYHPMARGFDEYYGFTSGHWGEYFDAPLEHNGRFVRGRGYIADDLTDKALEFITRNRANPFFCYVPFNTPHSPWTAPEEDWRRWRDRPIGLRGQDGDKEDIAITRCVLAMCENLDRNVGRVLRRLDELQLTENTIVVYFSDNGPNSWRWNGGMKGRKGSLDEGGIRSPLLIRWPGKIQPGTVIPQIAGAIDLLPTLAALAGVRLAPPRPLDGRDLTPLLLGAGAEWPERRIFTHHNGRVTVRTQQYRLDPAGGLFDLAADPGQKHDLARERPQIAAELTQAVAAWRQEVFGPDEQKSRKKLPDARPFTVGYREFPMTPLPARDGVAHDGVKRSASAPNSSYFVNWTSTSGYITWDIAVHTAGDYEAVVYYTCPEADAGSTVELGFRGSRVTAKVAPGWDPPLYQNQDTLPRPPAESQMKEFRPLALGTIRLPAGRGPLTLRALEMPGRSVMDVRGVVLTLKN